ncbi:MAG: response regulator [Thermodesulfobacteriota bacterium]
MARRVVVVDPSMVIRKIIRSTIHSHLGDVVVAEAEDGLEGLELLQADERCDLVLSGLEMSGLDGIELYWQMRQLPGRAATPFVLLTSTLDPAHLGRVRDAGIRDCLPIPFAPKTLVEIVGRLCDPAALRRSERYSIHGATALLAQGTHRFAACLVNISLGGLLCDLAFHGSLLLTRPAEISLAFPEEYEGLKVSGILSALVNFNVVAFEADHSPRDVRLAYKFVQVPSEAVLVLGRVLQIAERLKATEG